MEYVNGYIKRATTGQFCGPITKFDIPEGTRVVHNATDCDGNLFPHWVLPVGVARELSGNDHDSAHRFVIIPDDNVQPMVTRKEYMISNGKLHQAYYLQFATPQAKLHVLGRIGRERILASTDEHFNDIPLQQWDVMHDSLRALINQRLKGQAENFEIRRFGWSMSDAVCVAKAIAQEFRESGGAEMPRNDPRDGWIS
jgi:hypothetical protein